MVLGRYLYVDLTLTLMLNGCVKLTLAWLVDGGPRSDELRQAVSHPVDALLGHLAGCLLGVGCQLD